MSTMTENTDHFLGIDIGSVSLHYVLIDGKGQILTFKNTPHSGNVLNLFKDELDKMDLKQIRQIVFNKRAEDFFKAVEKKIGIPIVSIIYDRTMNRKNDLLSPYLYYIIKSLPSKTKTRGQTIIN